MTARSYRSLTSSASSVMICGTGRKERRPGGAQGRRGRSKGESAGQAGRIEEDSDDPRLRGGRRSLAREMGGGWGWFCVRDTLEPRSSTGWAAHRVGQLRLVPPRVPRGRLEPRVLHLQLRAPPLEVGGLLEQRVVTFAQLHQRRIGRPHTVTPLAAAVAARGCAHGNLFARRRRLPTASAKQSMGNGGGFLQVCLHEELARQRRHLSRLFGRVVPDLACHERHPPLEPHVGQHARRVGPASRRRDARRHRHPPLLHTERLPIRHVERGHLPLQQKRGSVAPLKPVSDQHARGVGQHRLWRTFDHQAHLPAEPGRLGPLPPAGAHLRVAEPAAQQFAEARVLAVHSQNGLLEAVDVERQLGPQHFSHLGRRNLEQRLGPIGRGRDGALAGAQRPGTRGGARLTLLRGGWLAGAVGRDRERSLPSCT
eukprot:scaffold912_cov108-Isochrysis_galbana.AAC.18